MKRSVLALVVPLVLSACATIPNVGTPLAMLPTFQINGQVFQPLSAFPEAAWRGLPQVSGLDDLQATSSTVQQLAAAAQDALRSNNTPLALAEATVARQLAQRGAAITAATMAAIQSLSAGSGRARIGGNALVVLPTYQGGLDSRPEDRANLSFAPIDLSLGVQVAAAGDDLSAAAEGLRQLTEMLGGKSKPQQQGYGNPGGVPYGKGELKDELPLNTPVRMINGLVVERRANALIAYNGSSTPVELDLAAINYLPPLPAPSPVRQKAAPIMTNISDTARSLLSHAGSVFTTAPNSFINSGGTTTVGWIDPTGHLTNDRNIGANAYRNSAVFKTAVDAIVIAENAPEITRYASNCVRQGFGYNYTVSGRYGEFITKACTRNNQPVYSKIFYLPEGSKTAVQTYESLLADRTTIAQLEKAYRDSADISGMMGFVPFLGNLENAAQCIGTDSAMQRAYMAAHQGWDKVNWRVEAALAQDGWTAPEDPQTAFSRTVNCLGALPLGGQIAKAGGKVAALAGKGNGVAAAIQGNQAYTRLFELFDNSLRPRKQVEALEAVRNLFPNNAGLASFVKFNYDTLQNAYNVSQFFTGLPTAVRVAKDSRS